MTPTDSTYSPPFTPSSGREAASDIDRRFINPVARGRGTFARTVTEAERTSSTRESGSSPQVSRVLQPLCKHYVRKCFVKLSCCNDYFACHQCHNDSGKCDSGVSNATAKDVTHLRCGGCHLEQKVNEKSQHCSGCSLKLAEYFCAPCKHFTNMAKDPYHCGGCGICRTQKNDSFHCDVCNLCMSNEFLGRHECRPNSAHESCPICLEDVFVNGYVFPCLHRVHQGCGNEMLRRGGRDCPVCLRPLFK